MLTQLPLLRNGELKIRSGTNPRQRGPKGSASSILKAWEFRRNSRMRVGTQRGGRSPCTRKGITLIRGGLFHSPHFPWNKVRLFARGRFKPLP